VIDSTLFCVSAGEFAGEPSGHRANSLQFPGEHRILWNAGAAQSVPWLFEAVRAFDAGSRDAGVRAAAWLRERENLRRPTQPAVLLTWIAKSVHHDVDGRTLLDEVIGRARSSADVIAATVLALDPVDADTASMWKSRFGFRPSQTVLSGQHDIPEEERLRRLWYPLAAARSDD